MAPSTMVEPYECKIPKLVFNPGFIRNYPPKKLRMQVCLAFLTSQNQFTTMIFLVRKRLGSLARGSIIQWAKNNPVTRLEGSIASRIQSQAVSRYRLTSQSLILMRQPPTQIPAKEIIFP